MIVDIRADNARVSQPFAAPVIGDSSFGEPTDIFELDQPLVEERRFTWVWPAVALLVVAAWIGGMLWLAWPELPLLRPVGIVQFAASLAIVPALIGIVWLLAMRTSRAEARRFGASARAMRAEAQSLERSIAGMTRSLEANRHMLGDQSAALAAMGDAVTERLTSIGRGLALEIGQVDAHSAALSEAAASARASLDTVLATLPRAQAETAAVGKLLDDTGLAASEHAAALDAQLAALSQRGHEADQVAGGAAQKLAAHIARMEATSETAGARLEAVTGEMSTAVDALLGRTADAVDEARKGIAAQGDAMLAMVGANQAALDSAARDSAEALGERIATVEAVIDRLAARLDRQRGEGDHLIAGLEAGIARVEGRIDALHQQGVERSQLLAASISALGGSADAMTEALRAGDAMATRTIGTTESLLIALDAASREIDETLPAALDRLDGRVAASKAVVVQARPELLSLVTAAESTHDAIEAIAGVIADQRRTLDHISAMLLQTLADGESKAGALGTMVDETIDRTHRFAEEAAPRLVDALLRVRDTAAVAADKARETLNAVIPEVAGTLETASAAAMRRATTDTVERQVRAIGEAGDAAVDAATRATERLAAQAQVIADRTAAIEGRLAEAREEQEERLNQSFARRSSQIIERLNSASIDITKALAPDVSDSAWQAYLKGDRGVFTRRAVRVLEPIEAQAIGRMYNQDETLRDLVNRYIRDFEGLLRGVLAERDGSAIGVTLLSSDMGKLYVALAQAIERLP